MTVQEQQYFNWVRKNQQNLKILTIFQYAIHCLHITRRQPHKHLQSQEHTHMMKIMY